MKPATKAKSASTAAALCNPWRSPTVQASSGSSASLFFKGVYVPEPAGLRDMTKSTPGMKSESHFNGVYFPEPAGFPFVTVARAVKKATTFRECTRSATAAAKTRVRNSQSSLS